MAIMAENRRNIGEEELLSENNHLKRKPIGVAKAEKSLAAASGGSSSGGVK
jgi:hypothetical protein